MDSVVYTALPGRFVVQSQDLLSGFWEDVKSFTALDDAKEYADGEAALFMEQYRVVDRSSS